MVSNSLFICCGLSETVYEAAENISQEAPLHFGLLDTRERPEEGDKSPNFFWQCELKLQGYVGLNTSVYWLGILILYLDPFAAMKSASWPEKDTVLSDASSI